MKEYTHEANFNTQWPERQVHQAFLIFENNLFMRDKEKCMTLA